MYEELDLDHRQQGISCRLSFLPQPWYRKPPNPDMRTSEVLKGLPTGYRTCQYGYISDPFHYPNSAAVSKASTSLALLYSYFGAI
jgi:hypothetical protein